jgi:hypothetical protein
MENFTENHLRQIVKHRSDKYPTYKLGKMLVNNSADQVWEYIDERTTCSVMVEYKIKNNRLSKKVF